MIDMPSTAIRFNHDGWSCGLRIGVVVPHADVGPEAEMQAMAAGAATIHGARLRFSAMRTGGEMDPKIPHAPVESFTQPPRLDALVEDLGQSPLDAIALAFTSSAYKHGPAGERALLRRLQPRVPGIPLVSTCSAVQQAAKALRAKRLAIVNPPWFDARLDGLSRCYFEAAGLTVVHHSPAGITSGQKHITQENMYAWVCGVIERSSPDIVFVAGNGQRAVGIIQAVESCTHSTLITANQVLLWASAKAAGKKLDAPHYGRLFGH